jgi:branched-chain amino acid aminotransferase
METLQAYCNGAWVASDELAVAVDDVGFLLGVTVTERLRTFRGKIFRLDAHLKRMRRSLEIVGLDAAGIVDQVAAAVPELVARNRTHLAPDDDWAISAFATPGRTGTRPTRHPADPAPGKADRRVPAVAGCPRVPGARGSGRPTVCVHGFPLPFHQWAGQYERGLPVVVSHVRQVPPNCWPPELKCRSRMHYYLADTRADAERPGARALLLDQDGNLGEATSANVLVYRKAEGLVSPPGEHILFGVSLGVVRELAGRLGVPFLERHLTVDELLAADEGMLASTSIVQCDGRPIGGGVPGPVYRRLLAAWSEMVGLDVADQARRFARR